MCWSAAIGGCGLFVSSQEGAGVESNPPSDPKLHVVKQVLLPLSVILTILIAALLGNNRPHDPVMLGKIPLEFIIFGVALVCVALKGKLHMEARDIALSGLGHVLAYHLYLGTDLVAHFARNHWHSVSSIVNIAGLLLGFAIMAALFKMTRIGDWLPAILPDDWKGGAALLCAIFVGSIFLDNIASAMIGGVIARKVFQDKVGIGFLAAIVACSNAGGAFSVVGDTTTTMIWIGGGSPLAVLPAAIGSLVVLAIVAFFAGRQQDAIQRITKDPEAGMTTAQIEWKYLVVVFWTLAGCIAANLLVGLPFIGVWAGLVTGTFLLKKGEMPWAEAKHMVKETVFITSLVAMADLMPVRELPPPSPASTFGIGGVSSGFDNIPLTALAILQDGYDWALLAFAVGCGGSNTWFGSSAGVALCAEFKQGQDLFAWLRRGWYVPVSYVCGFTVMFLLNGWNPSMLKPPKEPVIAVPVLPENPPHMR